MVKGTLVIRVTGGATGPDSPGDIVPPHKHDKYEGEFQGGKYHGRGTFTWSFGEKYEGDWVEGQQSGKGKFYNKDGKLEYDGPWENGEKHGKGKTYTVKDGEIVEEEVEYDHGMQIGTYEFPVEKRELATRIFQGTWKKGLFGKSEGMVKGTLRIPPGMPGSYADDNKYEGEFHHGQFHGKGTFTCWYGEKYEGQWVAGQPHGEGKLSRKGEILGKGSWTNGKMDGKGIDGKFYKWIKEHQEFKDVIEEVE